MSTAAMILKYNKCMSEEAEDSILLTIKELGYQVVYNKHGYICIAEPVSRSQITFTIDNESYIIFDSEGKRLYPCIIFEEHIDNEMKWNFLRRYYRRDSDIVYSENNECYYKSKELEQLLQLEHHTFSSEKNNMENKKKNYLKVLYIIRDC